MAAILNLLYLTIQITFILTLRIYLYKYNSVFHGLQTPNVNVLNLTVAFSITKLEIAIIEWQPYWILLYLTFRMTFTLTFELSLYIQ